MKLCAQMLGIAGVVSIFLTLGNPLPVDGQTYEPVDAKPASPANPVQVRVTKPAETEQAAKSHGSSKSASVVARDNGIVVGAPKVYDLQLLDAMMESVKSAVGQTTFPATSPLFGGLTGTQGTTSTASGLQIETKLTPSTSAASEDNTSAGVPGQAQQSSSFTPQATFSLSPSDLLAEQVSLYSQLVDLRMSFEGSVTDRVIHSNKGTSSEQFETKARLAVGFQISIDSRSEYRNAIAQAMITITNRDSSPRSDIYQAEPSLVLLLPQDKTYNTVSVSKDTKSFGLGAVVKVVSLGLLHEKKTETYFVGKDTDTVALEGIPGLPDYGIAETSQGGVSFGWQFRPVFTRSAVAPGTRQVFAVLSLPTSASSSLWEGDVHVRTCWRRYDAKTGTVGEAIPNSTSNWTLPTLVVPLHGGFQLATEPVVTAAGWEDVGDGKAAITLQGRNFFTGTAVACGDKLIDSRSNGLVLQTAECIRLVAPISTVLRSGITVLGKQGIAMLGSAHVLALGRDSAGRQAAVPPQQSDGAPTPPDPEQGAYPYSHVTASSRILRQYGELTAVEITLHGVGSPSQLLHTRRPLVQVGSHLYGAGDRPFTSLASHEPDEIAIRLDVPSDTIRTGILVVRDLLGPAAIPVKCGVADGSFVVDRALLLSEGDNTSIAITGTGLDASVSVEIGGKPVTCRRLGSASGVATCVICEVDRQTAASAKYITVTRGDTTPVFIPFPSSPAIAPAPATAVKQ